MCLSKNAVVNNTDNNRLMYLSKNAVVNNTDNSRFMFLSENAVVSNTDDNRFTCLFKKSSFFFILNLHFYGKWVRPNDYKAMRS